MSNLDDYYKNIMAEIRREADASGVIMVEAFFDRMTERLTEAGELDTADRAFYESDEGVIPKLRIDGYGGDPRDSEGVLGLIICDFVDSDEIKKFQKSDITPILNSLIRFLNKARTPSFRDSLSEANPAFQISDLIISTWSQITKIKLILISNRLYTGRDDSVKLAEVGNLSMTWSVWDLSRFERYDRLGQARADVAIDFEKEFGGALPALKASQKNAGLESYLLIIPGEQLAQIYDRWGARLLEANVRTFLQARAKTNKGIQKTIKEEPEFFFPYNNGLSATADAVTCIKNEYGLSISSINNLQIVNGAQTTGSIHAALRTSKANLEKIFVQMKLTVVDPKNADSIVPKISEFSNTQNKVNAADFFSSHPFHVRVEGFSRTILFAAAEGKRHDSKWFYERSRGQYLNERAMKDAAHQKQFDLEYPKNNFFTKTDLAKYEFSAIGKPHIVSRGAQKNFAEFAKIIGDLWSKNESFYDELWYRRLIAKAIIFKKLESEVPKQSWYEGGYRANIVTYAMSKVFFDSSRDKYVLDLDTIAKKQAVSDALLNVLLTAAKEAQDVITSPISGFKNISEWAKQQACWSLLENRKIDYAKNLERCLILKEIAEANSLESKKKQRQLDGINAQVEVVTLGNKYWADVLSKSRSLGLLSSKDEQILEICASKLHTPTEAQSKYALKIIERLNSGDD